MLRDGRVWRHIDVPIATVIIGSRRLGVVALTLLPVERSPGVRGLRVGWSVRAANMSVGGVSGVWHTSFAGSPHVRVRSLTQPSISTRSSIMRLSNLVTSSRRFEMNASSVTCLGGAGDAPT